MGNNLGNKQTMAKNIARYMKIHNMKRRDLADCMGVPYTTVCDWLNAETYPRIDKIEKMAQIFGVSKADLVENQTALDKAISSLPYYDTPVSAGNGAWLAEGHEYELCEFEDAPEDADFALRVCGDSMAPYYVDDDIVFVKNSVLVESGQVGVFCLNGEGYLKMLQGNRLISFNSSYKPVIVSEFDSFYIAGRVVGKANKPL